MFSRLTILTTSTMFYQKENVKETVEIPMCKLAMEQVEVIIGVGWTFSILALICNLLYYAVYPSEVEFGWKEKTNIYVLGTPRNVLNIFKCSCSTCCSSCCCGSSCCSSCSPCCQCQRRANDIDSDDEQIAL